MSRRIVSKVAAIIPAAGMGRRMGVGVPKQFLLLQDAPVLVHTLRVFDASPLIHEIVLVVPPGQEAKCRREMIQPYGFKKVSQIVSGGKTRQDSVYRGLLKVSPDVARIAIHDGVRPLISAELLKRVVEACREDQGAIAAVPLKDTPKAIRGDGTVDSTLEREQLYLAQTPQVFPRKVLIEAYRRAYTDGVFATDDSALVERLGVKVRVVEGHWENLKITSIQDLWMAEQILKMRRSKKTDEHSARASRHWV